MTTGTYAKELEQMLVDEFEASDKEMKEWVSLVLEILAKIMKMYWA